MITSTERLKIEYECSRMGRYKGYRIGIKYTSLELSVAFENWCEGKSHNREMEWDDYCDVRDGVSRGTNGKIRRERARQRWVN